MDAFVYCRVAPNDMRVSSSDKLIAQKQRCWHYANDRGLTVVRRYADCGDVHPIHLLPALLAMLEKITHSDDEIVVLTDHPGRLGLNQDIRKYVVGLIEKAGGIFIPVYGANIYSTRFLNLKG